MKNIRKKTDVWVSFVVLSIENNINDVFHWNWGDMRGKKNKTTLQNS